VFTEMAIGEFRIRINNRKVLRGLLQGFGVPEHSAAPVLRALDKVEKEDRSTILRELEATGLPARAAGDLYELIATKRNTQETLDALSRISDPSGALQAGLEELGNVVAAMLQFGVPDAAFGVDLSVVRGLDYYTGTIYETTLLNARELGSICSGGRYDDLASYFTNTRLPGVGISIGLTRLFSRLMEAGLLQPLPRTPAEVLVTTMDAKYLERYLAMARELRAAGINTEVYLETAKLGNQLTYADRKGFRVALIAGENEFAKDAVQLKDLGAKSARDVPIGELVASVQTTLKRQT